MDEPTSAITPMLVPPVVTHALDVRTASARPCRNSSEVTRPAWSVAHAARRANTDGQALEGARYAMYYEQEDR